MAETLSNRPVNYVKLKTIGEKVAGIFDSLSWDVIGTYGAESNVRLADGDGNLQQLRLDTALASIMRGAQDRLVKGQTHLTITFTGWATSKKAGSKPYKVFDVQADDLAPKGGATKGNTEAHANIDAAVAALNAPASIGDADDVPF